MTARTSYSLPGHVIVDLPVITKPSTNKLLRELRGLKLRVESMSEYFDEHGMSRSHTSSNES